MRCSIVTVRYLTGIFQRLIQIKLRGEMLLQFGFKHLREVLQTIQNMIGCRMSQAAMRMMLNQLTELFEFFDIVSCAAAVGNFIQIVFKQLRTHAARGAKTAAFMCKESCEIAIDSQQIALLPKY